MISLSPLIASADYNLMAPLGPLSGTVNLTAYVQGAFVVIIGLAGVLAVVMIVWCGIQLMGNPSVAKKGEAKSCITNSIIGVLLAAGAWIILNTVNSQLVSSDLNLGNTAVLPVLGAPVNGDDAMPTAPGWYFRFKDSDLKTKNSGRFGSSDECIAVMDARKAAGDTIVPTTSGSGTVECFEIKAIPQPAGETSVRNDLCGNDSCVGSKPIGINRAACSPPNLNGVVNKCTNVAGLPPGAVSAIKALQSACACDVVITGGTENGHATHAPSSPIFDLRKTPTLDAKLKSIATMSAPSFQGCRYFNSNYWYTDEGDHWHVCENDQPYWFCKSKDKSGKDLNPGKSPLCP